MRAETYHPSEPQTGFAGCAECDVKWSHVRWSLQGLDLSRRLAGWAGAHNVHLTHTKSVGKVHIKKYQTSDQTSLL